MPKAKPFTKNHRDGSLWAKGQTLDGVPTGYWEWYRKDGTKVERMDALSRTCAVMSKAAENGKRPVALMGTQLVSNLPVETFVFLNLQHHMPIVVMTPDHTAWGIIDGKIAKMDLSKH